MVHCLGAAVMPAQVMGLTQTLASAAKGKSTIVSGVSLLASVFPMLLISTPASWLF